MKKLLSTILAMAMLFCTFVFSAGAAGADETAASLPALPDKKELLTTGLFGAERQLFDSDSGIEAAAVADAGDDAADPEFTWAMFETIRKAIANETEALYFTPAILFLGMLGTSELRTFKSRSEVNAAYTAMQAKVKNSPQGQAYANFILYANWENIQQLQRNGALEDTLRTLRSARIRLEIAETETLIKEYFLGGVLFGCYPYAEFLVLITNAVEAGAASLPPEQYAEMINRLGKVYTERNARSMKVLNSGPLRLSLRLTSNIVTKDVKHVLADYGLSDRPSSFALVWNFILKYILFAWIPLNRTLFMS